MVSRQGGDEFSILLDDINHVGDLDIIAKKIIDTVALPMVINDKIVTVTASLGVALFPEHTTDLKKLWRYADLAMYMCKERKNAWCLFDTTMVDDHLDSMEEE